MAVGHLVTEGNTLKELMSPQGLCQTASLPHLPFPVPFIMTINAMTYTLEGLKQLVSDSAIM